MMLPSFSSIGRQVVILSMGALLAPIAVSNTAITAGARIALLDSHDAPTFAVSCSRAPNVGSGSWHSTAGANCTPTLWPWTATRPGSENEETAPMSTLCGALARPLREWDLDGTLQRAAALAWMPHVASVGSVNWRGKLSG